VNPMADGETWTAEELVAMSPNERYNIVKAGIVTDLDQIPPQFVERVRANVRTHITKTFRPAPDA